MKQYGFNFATEFSKKQINVVYAKAKTGGLKVERWYMQNLHSMADYYGHDDSRSVSREERSILNILDHVFKGEMEEAQKLIDEQTEYVFGLLSFKNQKSCDRTLI